MSYSFAELLVPRLARGDREALVEFYDRYVGMVHGLALRILRDTMEAQDVVQEVFIQVWREVGGYEPHRDTPTAWVCSLARRRALDHLRRRRSHGDSGGQPAQASHCDPLVRAHPPLHEALDGLSTSQRRVLEMAYFEGLTQQEIGERLAAPPATVKARLVTALARLRAVWSGHRFRADRPQAGATPRGTPE
jgi:RNA polymerase sigma-70 factor (ECF subfamily)